MKLFSYENMFPINSSYLSNSFYKIVNFSRNTSYFLGTYFKFQSWFRILDLISLNNFIEENIKSLPL